MGELGWLHYTYSDTHIYLKHWTTRLVDSCSVIPKGGEKGGKVFLWLHLFSNSNKKTWRRHEHARRTKEFHWLFRLSQVGLSRALRTFSWLVDPTRSNCFWPMGLAHSLPYANVQCWAAFLYCPAPVKASPSPRDSFIRHQRCVCDLTGATHP